MNREEQLLMNKKKYIFESDDSMKIKVKINGILLFSIKCIQLPKVLVFWIILQCSIVALRSKLIERLRKMR